MPLADWGKALFPLLVFKENVTALAVDYMKNRHITVLNGKIKKMAKYIIDYIVFRDTMWELYATHDAVKVALQALLKAGERIEEEDASE